MKKETLKNRYFRISLVISSLFLLLSLVTMFFLLVQLIDGEVKVSLNQIESILPELERSIENEIVVGNKKAIKEIINNISTRYHLSKVDILDGRVKCEPPPFFLKKEVCVDFTIDKFKSPIFMQITKKLNTGLLYNLIFKSMIMFLVIFLLSIVVIFLVLRHFQKLLIEPIIKLSKDPYVLESTHYSIEEIENIRSTLIEFYKNESAAISSRKEIKFKVMMGDIALRIAHDLKSPLESLRFLLSKVKGNNNIQSLISQCMNEMGAIISELIHSKNESNVDKYYTKNLIPVDLIEFLSDFYTTRNTIYKRDIIDVKIKVDVDKVIVNINPFRLKNILDNIVTNAMEAGSNCSDLKISMSLSVDNDCVTIKISDNGAGFSAEVLEYFGKQYITKGKMGGNGIGLFSSYKYLVAIGGSMKICNEEIGASVFLSLPIKKISEVSNLMDEPVISVLLDDSEVIRESWKLKAEDKGVIFYAFDDEKKFMEFISSINKQSHIYIDYLLNGDARGDEIAKKLHEIGYKNIFLTTGFDKKRLKEKLYLKDVLGKYPPF